MTVVTTIHQLSKLNASSADCPTGSIGCMLSDLKRHCGSYWGRMHAALLVLQGIVCTWNQIVKTLP